MLFDRIRYVPGVSIRIPWDGMEARPFWFLETSRGVMNLPITLIRGKGENQCLDLSSSHVEVNDGASLSNLCLTFISNCQGEIAYMMTIKVAK